MKLRETIVALSTPPGLSGMGVVRVSGSQARSIAERILRFPHPVEWRSWHAAMAELVEEAGCAVDQVITTYFAAPRSYTGEDVVEISCHGSPVVLRCAIDQALRAGARLAEPGEFTLRAFLNGRIDLPQAEAVRDLIEATTLYQAKVAAQQVEGAVSRRISPIKEQLLELIALLEAGIDFADDDVSVASDGEILRRLIPVREGVAALVRSFAFGKLVHQGVTLAIVGRPNTGKSSLFNRLLEQERAIVTSIPGTTRDLVSETASIHGIPVRLVDTAGIREAEGLVETLGIERSFRAMTDADLTLVVLDLSQPAGTEDIELIEKARQRGRCLLVGNKADLVRKATPQSWDPLADARGSEGSQTNWASVLSRDREGAVGLSGPENEGLLRKAQFTDAHLTVSALTGEGIEELRQAIVDSLAPERVPSQEFGFITSLRHERLLSESLEYLLKAEGAVEDKIPHEMLLLDLYSALKPIDAITGATTADDILNRIFSTFCIGK